MSQDSTSDAAPTINVLFAPTINELFHRDPLNYSAGDLDRIIARLRECRHTFNTTGKSASTAKPKAKAKVSAEAASLSASLDLKL